MRPGGSPLWLETARLGPLVDGVLLLATVAAALLALHALCRRPALRRHMGALRSSVHHRAVCNFSEAVAAADFGRADAVAAWILGGHCAAEPRHRRELATWSRRLPRVAGPCRDILDAGRGRLLQLKLLPNRWPARLWPTGDHRLPVGGPAGQLTLPRRPLPSRRGRRGPRPPRSAGRWRARGRRRRVGRGSDGRWRDEQTMVTSSQQPHTAATVARADDGFIGRRAER